MGLFSKIFSSTEEKELGAINEQIERAKEGRNRLQQQNRELEEKRRKIQSEYENERDKRRAQIEEECQDLLKKKCAIQGQLDDAHDELVELDEKVLLQSFGLYEPKYSFMNSDEYADALKKNRDQQKQLVKDDEAATGYTDWEINGSAAQGRKMVKDMKKLLLRAFNSECEHVVGKVKYNNFDSCEKRIIKSYEAIGKLGTVMNIQISELYLALKRSELHLAFEYQQKKQEEKEHLRELRAQEREEAKLRKEIEEERKKIRKEQAHYENALKAAKDQLQSASEEEKEELSAKIRELESHMEKVEKNLKDMDYREANQRAGYVYVISNIGSFGEGVYKIGMTRRLDPMDRVNELGDASVPFNFDVHAMIFSDDAPALEAALHNAFADKKVNMVNTRREFFKVPLEEIKRVVKEKFDGIVEFLENADAEQYRESVKIREAMECTSSKG